MKNPLPLLILAISSIFMTSCGNEQPKLLTCTEFSLDCEEQKDYSLLHVSNIKKQHLAGTFWEYDALGHELKDGWYVRFNKTHSLLPISMFIDGNSILKYSDLNRIEFWMRDSTQKDLEHEFLSSKIKTVEDDIAAADVEVVLTGGGEFRVDPRDRSLLLP